MLPCETLGWSFPVKAPTSLRWIAKLSSGTTNRFTTTTEELSLSPYPNVHRKPSISCRRLRSIAFLKSPSE